MQISPEQHCIANMREYIQVLQILAASVESAGLKTQMLGKMKQLGGELENLNSHIQEQHHIQTTMD